MAEHSPGKPIYVTMQRENDLVRRHIRDKGRAVALEEGLNGRLIVLYEGEEQIPLLWARQIPATVEGHAIHNVQNAMFATAIAHAMGISLENIRQGLRTFTTDFFQTPGRMNFYNEHPFRVLLDYAHNAHGMTAMAQTVARADRQRPADRRPRRPGRPPGRGHPRPRQRRRSGLRLHHPARGRRPARAAGRARPARWSARGSSPPASRRSGSRRRSTPRRRPCSARSRPPSPGDLLVIFGDDLDRVWHQIVSFGRPAAAPDVPAQSAPVFAGHEPPLASAIFAPESPADPGMGGAGGLRGRHA